MKPIELEYREGEDGMLYPVLNHNNEPIGKYGMMFLKHLKEHNPDRYTLLNMEDKLVPMALSVNEEAHQAIDKMVLKMLETDPIKDPSNTMETYKHKNTLRMIAESTIIRELVLIDR